MMKDETSGDPVNFFAKNAEEFHGMYRTAPEFLERLDVWHDLLDRFGKRGGLSLDMGCGPGVFTFYLAEKMGGRVVGIDGAADMVAACEAERDRRGLQNVRFVQARLPEIDESDCHDADLIISSSVVVYVEDLDATLALFARLMKPKGALVISMPNRASVSRTYHRLKYLVAKTPIVYRYIRHFSSPRALHRRVRRHGLRLVEARYYSHFTRLSKLGRALHAPLVLTEDLFVAVFRKA
jgi:2-polyprenyl-6-hydroxyphenyl methylase/3-demethylubiquinone-9 3-methyltransferase